VPELSRFFGIIIRMFSETIIRMFSETASPHHETHFHAYYQDEVGVFAIDPVELFAGALPQRQRRFVEAWAELHQEELLAAWTLLHAGRKARPIEPLK